MGMDDREANFGEHFGVSDRFVLTGLRYDGVINTRYGPAEKSLARIVSRDHPDEQRVYIVLGVGIANQAKRAEQSDFPRVVELVSIPTGKVGNEVKRFAKVEVDPRAFLNGDDGPSLEPYDGTESRTPSFGGAAEDIPF